MKTPAFVLGFVIGSALAVVSARAGYMNPTNTLPPISHHNTCHDHDA